MSMQQSLPEQPQPHQPDYRERGRALVNSPVGRFVTSEATRRVVARSAMASRLVGIGRWFWMAEWGSLLVAVVLALLGVIGIIQHDTLLGLFVLVIAGLAAGIWLIVRAMRRFVDRQIGKVFARFERLMTRNNLTMQDWPNWYRQHRNDY